MLLLAAAALPGKVEAATVDHGLRAENADEARMVADICAQAGVPHAILPVTLQAGNVQAEARAARYGALAAWMEDRGLDALATAHHADDQAETLLMRLNRGSGVSGLAGVRALGFVPGARLALLRPLLGWRRSALAEVVAEAGIAAVQDPSNRDDRFDRARLRKHLAQSDWLDVPALATSALHLADADAALGWAAGREWQEQVVRDGLGLLWKRQPPRAIALKVMARIVAELDGGELRGSALARAFAALSAGQVTSLGSLVARPTPEGWHFARAPVRRDQPIAE